MSGFTATDPAGIAATWAAAAATIVVLGGMLGERRAFALAQHLFAGLATGYLVVVATREVLVPRLVLPLLDEPLARPELYLGLVLAVGTAATPWLPRRAAAIPVTILVGSLAAFALGGALMGTVLPQAAAAIVEPGPPADLANGILGLAVTSLVMLSLARGGAGSTSVIARASSAGRWLLVGGIGAWLAFLLVSRLVLLVDRLGFLLVDWLGIGR
jgi:hypothetical protein